MITTDLDFNGNIYISSNRASELTGYTNDYVGQLARVEKIKAKKIGRAWFVEKNSILEHRKSTNLQKKEVGLVPPLYVSKIPALLKKKALIPILISVFLILSVVATPYINSINMHKISFSNMYVLNIKKNFSDSLSEANYKVQKLAQSSSDFITAKITTARASSSDLFSTYILEDSLHEVSVNLASASEMIDSFFSTIHNYLNKVVTKLAVNVYTSINNSYAGSANFMKRPSIEKNLALNNIISEKQYTSQSGLVIIPTSEDKTVDEKERKNIKERFSDEVSVVFDTAGGSGVITPVFRNDNDQSYSFVLVPITRLR